MRFQWHEPPRYDMSPIPDGVLDCTGGMMIGDVYYTRLGLSEMSSADLERLQREARRNNEAKHRGGMPV